MGMRIMGAMMGAIALILLAGLSCSDASLIASLTSNAGAKTLLTLKLQNDGTYLQIALHG